MTKELYMARKLFMIFISSLLLFSFSALAADSDEEKFENPVDLMNSRIDYAGSVFRDATLKYSDSKYSSLTTPLRLYGYLTGRFQHLATTGMGRSNHSSMEEFMSIWFDGALGNIGYRLLLNLERPRDEGRGNPELLGHRKGFY